MAKHTGKILAGIVTLAAVGAIAYAATDEDEDEGGIQSGGMVLSGGCDILAVEDPVAYVEAWMEYGAASDAHLLDAEERADVEQFVAEFLGTHFPDCFPPVPGADFTWLTTSPETGTMTWDEAIDRIMEGFAKLPVGFEGAAPDAPYNFEAAGKAVATTPTFYEAVVTEPVGPPWEPGIDLPLPPLPEPEPEGEGAEGDWAVVPDNVVQAVTAANMAEGGISRAMEAAGSTSPQESAVFLVYDPNYPSWLRLRNDLYGVAAEHPEILFVIASTADTIKTLGKPEHPGLGYAVNAADREGDYKYEAAQGVDWDEGPLSEDQWQSLVIHALSPHEATFTQA